MFQYFSLVKKSLDQCEIARAFWIQDKSGHGLVKMTYFLDNCWCPYNIKLQSGGLAVFMGL